VYPCTFSASTYEAHTNECGTPPSGPLSAETLVTKTVARPTVTLPPAVHIVEDDEDVRVATARLLTTAGYMVQTYASASEFLARMQTANPGCVVLDVQLPGPSGLELQEILTKTAEVRPIIFVSGHGDIPMSVRTIKAGAVDFLTKPVQKDVLLSAVARAMAREAEERAAQEHKRAIQARYNRLTPREREVFAHLISGQLNKQIAFDLGTSERTIKAHRHSIMQKLEAESVVDLIRVSSELHIAPTRGDS
jgi:FixJ family two-component response regulator